MAFLPVLASAGIPRKQGANRTWPRCNMMKVEGRGGIWGMERMGNGRSIGACIDHGTQQTLRCIHLSVGILRMRLFVDATIATGLSTVFDM